MKELIKNKQLLIPIISAVILATFVLIIAINLLFRPTSPNPPTSPTPTSSQVKFPTINPGTNENDIEQSETYRKSFQKASEEERPLFERDRTVGKLLNKLPYIGNNFHMEYSYAQNQFSVTIKNNNRDTGIKEFNQFLNVNGIENQNWIQNLTILYE